VSLVFLALGFLLVTIGLSALALAAAFWTRGVRMLVAFGAFSVIYGISMLVRSTLVPSLLGVSGQAALFVLWQTNYWSSIPALIYTEEARGRGWHGSLRLMWMAWIPLALGLTAVDVWLQRPGAWSPAYFPFVLVMQGTILAHLVWGRSTFREARTIQRIGGIGFLVAIIYDNLAGIAWPNAALRLEPFGAVAFIGSLAITTGRQFFARERELAVVESEMNTARGIQESILPRADLRLPGLQITARYLPMRGIAGDLYDFHVPDDHRVGVLVADVTGHGVPAALIASMAKVAFSAELAAADQPGVVLSAMNRTLCGHLSGQFITAAYLFFDTERGDVRYSVAGHPPPILWRRRSGAAIDLAEIGGMLLGFQPTATYHDGQLSVEAGDRVLVYTDGLIEAEDRDGRPFGDVRLREMFALGRDLSSDGFADLLLDAVRAWSAHRGSDRAFDDDLTFVVVDIGAIDA
jgi:sigma-B regulation protein RsbU (phosphoserine phosphatase)